MIHMITLPPILLHNGGREEFTRIMDWLHSIGEKDTVWHYYALTHRLAFAEREDLTAFKLRFGI